MFNKTTDDGGPPDRPGPQLVWVIVIIVAGVVILVATAVVITWLCVRKKDNSQVTVFVAQPGFGEIKPLDGGLVTAAGNIWATMDNK